MSLEASPDRVTQQRPDHFSPERSPAREAGGKPSASPLPRDHLDSRRRILDVRNCSSQPRRPDPRLGERYRRSGHGEGLPPVRVAHRLEAKNKVGPQLRNGIEGRKMASIADFELRRLKKVGEDGGVWTAANLAVYLKDPKAFSPGTKMASPASKDGELADVWRISCSSAPPAPKWLKTGVNCSTEHDRNHRFDRAASSSDDPHLRSTRILIEAAWLDRTTLARVLACCEVSPDGGRPSSPPADGFRSARHQPRIRFKSTAFPSKCRSSAEWRHQKASGAPRHTTSPRCARPCRAPCPRAKLAQGSKRSTPISDGSFRRRPPDIG